MFSSVSHEIGGRLLTLETGKLAQQAGGAVVIRHGDSVLLVTATMSNPREGIDFFPLTVDFEERMYARGKIPGSFFRREGRPSTHGTLIARMTDRPIRPLFPKGFNNEVQIIGTALSADQETPLDIMSIVGASAALSVSDIPFEGPIAATQIGYVDGGLVINPTYEQLERSDLDLIAAGSSSGVVMMEAGASELPESVVLDAIELAQEVNQTIISLQRDLALKCGKPKADFVSTAYPEELDSRVAAALNGRLAAAMGAPGDKADRDERMGALKDELVESLSGDFDAGHIGDAFEARVEEEFKTRVLDGGSRPDGRGRHDLRAISSEVGLMPRTHGTGLFTRGETQVLGIATLGSVGDAQRLDTLDPEESKRFMLHYNFPPFSVGEVRRVGSPSRRSIGHGALAERALAPVIPDEEEFPYTIRLVCEVLSSNGSTSMGSVCAGTLALMDAGVPIKAPVAGISIGLIAGDDGRYTTLTDIQGMEDHVGDMDFKVAGSLDGITGIQLDIKLKSIGFDVIRDALEQGRKARLEILDRIHETISESRSELSPYAPRMSRIQIPVDRIGMVIGPGGKTIRGIIEETGATVDVQDDGSVFVGATTGEAADRAIKMIRDLTRDVEVGEIYTGKVVKIANFGAFVQLLPGKDGLVHISELADHHVPSVEDVVELGDEITVVVTEIDSMGRVNLSRRALIERPENGDGGGYRPPQRPSNAGQRGPAPVGSRPGPRDRSGGGPRGGGHRPSGPRRGGPGGGPRSGPPGRRGPPR